MIQQHVSQETPQGSYSDESVELDGLQLSNGKLLQPNELIHIC